MDKAKQFLGNLTSYGVGNLIEEMADLQTKIIEAVRGTGKVGSLTLKLSYKINGSNQIIIDSNVTPKIPRNPVAQVAMFADDKNQLHEENPEQLKYNTEKVVKLESKKVIND